jgi:hypothetical protein
VATVNKYEGSVAPLLSRLVAQTIIGAAARESSDVEFFGLALPE